MYFGLAKLLKCTKKNKNWLDFLELTILFGKRTAVRRATHHVATAVEPHCDGLRTTVRFFE